jgi:glycosyltransferase involved in cell wall biosynthesis
VISPDAVNPKILVVTRTTPHHIKGGMEIVAWQLAGALPNAQILTTAAPGMPEGVHTVDVDFRDRHAWRAASATAFQDIEADIILGVSSAANGLIPLRRPGQKFIFQAHGTASGEIVSKLRAGNLRAIAGATRNLYWGVTQDPIYRRYDHIVAVGSEVYLQLVAGPSRLLVGRTPVSCINNGVDVKVIRFQADERQSIRSRLGASNDSRVFLSLSRLTAQKGVDISIRAFAEMAMPQDRLVIAGSGSEMESLRNLVKNLDLGGQVYFSGELNRSDLSGYLSAADALVFPTRRVEVGYTLNVLEAFATGLQVIASGGLMVEPKLPIGDVASFAARMRQVQPGHRLPPISHEFTLEGCAAKYSKLFASLYRSQATSSSRSVSSKDRKYSVR